MRGSPSGSASLPSKLAALMTTGVSSSWLPARSLTATGASLTAPTVRLATAVSVPPRPSLMVEQERQQVWWDLDVADAGCRLGFFHDGGVGIGPGDGA